MAKFKSISDILAVLALIITACVVVCFWGAPIILAFAMKNWLILFLYVCWIPISVFFTIFVGGIWTILIELL